MKNLKHWMPLVLVWLLPGTSLAASGCDIGGALPSNYQFELDAQAGEETMHVSFVVASEKFEISVGTDFNVTFRGTVSLADNGTLVLTYNLGFREKVAAGEANGGRQSFQYVENGLMGSVRLREGKQISLITVGNRSLKLKITKLAED